MNPEPFLPNFAGPVDDNDYAARADLARCYCGCETIEGLRGKTGVTEE